MKGIKSKNAKKKEMKKKEMLTNKVQEQMNYQVETLKKIIMRSEIR